MKIALNEALLPTYQLIIDTLGKDNVYLVGGVVRDTLLKKETHDLDFACLLSPEEIHAAFKDSVFQNIMNSGYHSYSFEKKTVMQENNYSSICFMNKMLKKDYLLEISKKLFMDKAYGNVIRIKGFFMEADSWYLMNLTKDSFDVSPIAAGQDVIIVIGENLLEDKIKEVIEK